MINVLFQTAVVSTRTTSVARTPTLLTLNISISTHYIDIMAFVQGLVSALLALLGRYSD